MSGSSSDRSARPRWTEQTRRQFVVRNSLATASAVMVPLWSSRGDMRASRERDTAFGSTHLDDLDLKALSQRALEAATTAGASYADVRFTRTARQQFQVGGQRDLEMMVAGVRVLVNGAWGFAANTMITPESMAWMGKTAASLGHANGWPQVSPIVLDKTPSAVGRWTMPVTRDPTTVSLEEKEALVAELNQVAGEYGGKVKAVANFERQERAFASTEGTFTQQTVYTTFGTQPANRFFKSESKFEVDVTRNGTSSTYRSSLVSPTGQGYEAFTALGQNISAMIEHAQAASGATPLASPGRYEVVFDGYAVAALVNALGNALEIDRILGYEAGGVGTSYLAPLDKVIGTAVAPGSVTVTADRTMPGGAATVQWDDEGIATHAFPLIQSGRLMDCSTGREFLPELAAWYGRQQWSMRSHGCMSAENAKLMPLVQTPNLTLVPSSQDTDFDALLSGITDGFAVLGGTVNMDQQLLTGLGRGTLVYAVKQGKLAGVVNGVGYSFRLPDLWKQLVGLGGARTTVTRGFTVTKGQPSQFLSHSVRAVAARFKDVTVRSLGGK